MTHIALEGRCFVLSACQHLRRTQFPDAQMHNALPEAADGVLMRGGNLVIDPLGRKLAGPVFNEDALLTAELDLDPRIHPRHRWFRPGGPLRAARRVLAAGQHRAPAGRDAWWRRLMCRRCQPSLKDRHP